MSRLYPVVVGQLPERGRDELVHGRVDGQINHVLSKAISTTPHDVDVPGLLLRILFVEVTAHLGRLGRCHEAFVGLLGEATQDQILLLHARNALIVALRTVTEFAQELEVFMLIGAEIRPSHAMVQVVADVDRRLAPGALLPLSMEDGKALLMRTPRSRPWEGQQLEGLGAQHAGALAAIVQWETGRTGEELAEFHTYAGLWAAQVNRPEILVVAHAQGAYRRGRRQAHARADAVLVQSFANLVEVVVLVVRAFHALSKVPG